MELCSECHCSDGVVLVPVAQGTDDKEAMDQHIVTFEFVRETSFFELFSVFELLCMAGWLTVLW